MPTPASHARSLSGGDLAPNPRGLKATFLVVSGRPTGLYYSICTQSGGQSGCRPHATAENVRIWLRFDGVSLGLVACSQTFCRTAAQAADEVSYRDSHIYFGFRSLLAPRSFGESCLSALSLGSFPIGCIAGRG